jgi:hypothetical protein
MIEEKQPDASTTCQYYFLTASVRKEDTLMTHSHINVHDTEKRSVTCSRTLKYWGLFSDEGSLMWLTPQASSHHAVLGAGCGGKSGKTRSGWLQEVRRKRLRETIQTVPLSTPPSIP